MASVQHTVLVQTSTRIADEETVYLGKSSIQTEEERLLQAARAHMVEQMRISGTQRLNGADRNAVPLLNQMPFGLRVGAVSHYLPLPGKMAAAADDLSVLRWRIELHGLPNSGPIGLDILSDVVFGRGNDEGEIPDYDLDAFRALDRGVSRRHALLRPSPTSLYLIDLHSTNGTRCNMAPVGLGRAFAIHHNDTITLGNLTFQVKVIDSPVMPRA